MQSNNNVMSTADQTNLHDSRGGGVATKMKEIMRLIKSDSSKHKNTDKNHKHVRFNVFQY
jgi:hypothetical protein